MKKDSLAVVSATFATSYMEARYFFTFMFLQLLSFQSYCLDALKNERLWSWHFEIIMIVFDIHLNSFWVVLGIWTWCITVVTITMKCPLSSGHKFCKGNKTESRLRIWFFFACAKKIANLFSQPCHCSFFSFLHNSKVAHQSTRSVRSWMWPCDYHLCVTSGKQALASLKRHKYD